MITTSRASCASIKRLSRHRHLLISSGRDSPLKIYSWNTKTVATSTVWDKIHPTEAITSLSPTMARKTAPIRKTWNTMERSTDSLEEEPLTQMRHPTGRRGGLPGAPKAYSETKRGDQREGKSPRNQHGRWRPRRGSRAELEPICRHWAGERAARTWLGGRGTRSLKT